PKAAESGSTSVSCWLSELSYGSREACRVTTSQSRPTLSRPSTVARSWPRPRRPRARRRGRRVGAASTAAPAKPPRPPWSASQATASARAAGAARRAVRVAGVQERVAVVLRRDEGLLDRAWADPADQVPHRAGLVVR